MRVVRVFASGRQRTARGGSRTLGLEAEVDEGEEFSTVAGRLQNIVDLELLAWADKMDREESDG